MKKFFLITFSAALLFIVNTQGSFAQHNQKNASWQDKLQSEKIAFLSTEMDLTPQEAQQFWPVYNQLQKDYETANIAVFESFRKLEEAVRNNKGQNELAKLVKAYSEALDKTKGQEAKKLSEYMKVLPSEKVARLYIAEEKFRQSQIFKLRQPIPQDSYKR